MVQILEKEEKSKDRIELDESLILEELPMEREQVEEVDVASREKPVKKALLKLIRKSKYNPNYLKETIPIEKLKNKFHFRNYGVY